MQHGSHHLGAITKDNGYAGDREVLQIVWVAGETDLIAVHACGWFHMPLSVLLHHAEKSYLEHRDFSDMDTYYAAQQCISLVRGKHYIVDAVKHKILARA